jgi:hypothetical protein
MAARTARATLTLQLPERSVEMIRMTFHYARYTRSTLASVGFGTSLNR